MERSSRSRRVTQRQPLSCTECARHKIKCSKEIPCTYCLNRGKGHLCHREEVEITSREATKKRKKSFSSTSPASSAAQTGQAAPREEQFPLPTSYSEIALPTPNASVSSVTESPQHIPRLIDGVANDAGVTLEFLTLGRQRVLQTSTGTLISATTDVRLDEPFAIDPILSESQVMALLIYHEQNMAWFHNVVHLPTFREQCAVFFAGSPPPDPFWAALYCAILSLTIYHMHPDLLERHGIFSPKELAQDLHRRSINALHAARFMAVHSVVSVQTICLLIYVGHNIGESDEISVLLAAAIRIAQSLNLHRLGTEKTKPRGDADRSMRSGRALIDREVEKRVWWFLVRQDWLQIPFLNTYSIHPTQFNTPMPKNCHEDFDLMISSNSSICEQDVNTYTQGSYTSILNHISVLIWKAQDRMCSVGNTRGVDDGLRKLYQEVIQADKELKSIVKSMPVFFQEQYKDEEDLPPHIKQQRQVTLLSLTHKFFTLHRHFQVLSFKDPWFSYTKISCLSIARRGLQGIFSLPDDQYTWIAKSLWTVNTHTVTAAIGIMFEVLFQPDDETTLFDREEMRDTVRNCAATLRMQQDRSEIARKGVRLIECLLEMDVGRAKGTFKQFDVEDIIAYVKAGGQSEGDALVDEQFLNSIDWLSATVNTWEGVFGTMDGWPTLDL